MTILTNIGLQKTDAVEIERRYSGCAVRRAAYLAYILLAVISRVFYNLKYFRQFLPYSSTSFLP